MTSSCSMSQRAFQNFTRWVQRHSFPVPLSRIRRPILEGFAMGFILTFSIAVYILGVIWYLPVVLGETSFITQCVAFIAATWCLFGVWTNLLLLRFRDTSIRHRFLSEPVIVASSPMNENVGQDGRVRERSANENVKNLSQQFMISPFGSETAWHVCGVCEIYVPPRTWHCHTCNICILRRDHHCVFAMSCIGEDNQVNFIGLLAYLSVGTTYATILGMCYMYHFGVSPTLYILKAVFTMYMFFFDLTLMNLLSSVSFIGGVLSWIILIHYLLLALKNQTSADHSRGVRRSLSLSRQYSYQNLTAFLGPNPVLRILWPLCPVLKTDYSGGAAKRSSHLDSSKTV